MNKDEYSKKKFNWKINMKKTKTINKRAQVKAL